ncbi:MAG: hypothetical protein R3B93_27160 [Bacteroidia bacterium]
MKANVLYWSILVATGGFLFGFDTVVISGANLPIKELWQTTPFSRNVYHVYGPLGNGSRSTASGFQAKVWVEKLFLDWCFIFDFRPGFSVCWDPFSFLFRFIGGLGVGASTVAAPTYISENFNREKQRH